MLLILMVSLVGLNDNQYIEKINRIIGYVLENPQCEKSESARTSQGMISDRVPKE